MVRVPSRMRVEIVDEDGQGRAQKRSASRAPTRPTSARWGCSRSTSSSRCPPSRRRAAAATASHPVRYFPFATFGINLTGFIVQLLDARLLDHRLYIAHDARGLLTAATTARLASPVASPVAGGARRSRRCRRRDDAALGEQRAPRAAASPTPAPALSPTTPTLAAGMDELNRMYGELQAPAKAWVEASPRTLRHSRRSCSAKRVRRRWRSCGRAAARRRAAAAEAASSLWGVCAVAQVYAHGHNRLRR